MVNGCIYCCRVTCLFFVLLLFFGSRASAQYKLTVVYIGKDTGFPAQPVLQTEFSGIKACADYIRKLPSLLLSEGYPAASVDSVKVDSSLATVQVFLGPRLKYIQLDVGKIERKALLETGLSAAISKGQIEFSQVQPLQQRLLAYYENSGYPFASVFLDSVVFLQDRISAILMVNKGPLYHIDSIRIYGKAVISNFFLQQYLGISNGSLYNKARIQQIGKKLSSLPFLQVVQPSDISLLGSGSIVNLYLNPQKCSQVNFLVGFLPASSESNKLRLTGDVNLNLKNALGRGESILINWQQLQEKSPRLNIAWQHPYIFRSPLGLDFSFDLFKKDSTYMQINGQLGVQYLVSANQSGKIFFQTQNSFLLAAGVDTNVVKSSKKLPANIDYTAISFGVDYEWNSTNYRYNPVMGNELHMVASAGIKTLKKNNDIVSIKDPSYDYNKLYDSLKMKSYQLKIILDAAHYFRTGRQGTLRFSVSAAQYVSPDIFRNDLFQIGGFRLLRGFDEESIYATRYAVASAEYRYLTALNSYFFGFSDIGWARNNYQAVDLSNRFLSAGIGIVFETKMGVLKLSYAVGKRDDVTFNFRKASRIHFGYINYF